MLSRFNTSTCQLPVSIADFALERKHLSANYGLGSDISSDQELPNYIPEVPKEYYDQYHLIFSHFNLDRKIARIGLNGRQKRSAGLTNDYRGSRQADDSWDSPEISRKKDHLQQIRTGSSKIPRSQHLLN